MKTLEDKVSRVMPFRSKRELAPGWLRYEAVRKLSPRRYAGLCERNIRDDVAFDDLVDELIMGDK
jgi:hypothetical protein